MTAIDRDDSPSTELEHLEDASREQAILSHNIGGRFRVTERLAEGGMSSVYLAEQLDLDRKVAIKLLKRSPGFEGAPENALWRKRFEREASLLAKLAHPNIVVVHEYGVTSRGDAYLVMEYIDGCTVLKAVRERERLDEETALVVLMQITSALEEAHALGSVHRDLKPQNVMLVRGRFDRVKVLDFGIAKVLRKQGDVDQTQDGTYVGSPRYMAPEQIVGEDVTPAADVYALGCLTYFMLTGNPPFRHTNPIEVLAAHLREVPVPLSEANATVSPALSRIVMRCLEKRPKDRYANASEMLAEVRALTQAMPKRPFESTASTPQASFSISVEAPESSRRWPLALAALLTLGVGIALGVTQLIPRASPQVSTLPTAPSQTQREPLLAASQAPSATALAARPTPTIELAPTRETPTRVGVPSSSTAVQPAHPARRIVSMRATDHPAPEPASGPAVAPPEVAREPGTPPRTRAAVPTDNLDPWE